MTVAKRYGAGSVYQLPNGRWAGQWSAGRDPYGRRIRGTVTADSESAAWKALTTARAKSSSTRRRRGGETVGAFLDRWLVDVVAKTRRERTLIGYRSIVDRHLAPKFGTVPLVQLTRRDVQAWVNTQKGAPLSVRHRLDCLRAALSWAVRWDLLDANPAKDIDLPSVPRRTVTALRPEDAKAIIAATAECWFAPLVTVALYTGLRQGELLGLRWEDVNLAGGTLTVSHSLARLTDGHGIRYVLTEPKSSRSRRTVPLAAPALEALAAVRRDALEGEGNRWHLVFTRDGLPVDGPTLTYEFQAALKVAGVPAMRWHDLRHGFVSLLIAAGVPIAVVSQMAGHSGIGITVDTYGHLTADARREAIDALGRAVG